MMMIESLNCRFLGPAEPDVQRSRLRGITVAHISREINELSVASRKKPSLRNIIMKFDGAFAKWLQVDQNFADILQRIGSSLSFPKREPEKSAISRSNRSC
jgi:hypothetical protein